MKISAIIQARMSSKRFPGKVLHPVSGKPLLTYLLESVRRCQRIDQIILATSDDVSDDPVAHYADQNKMACFRGSLTNVTERFLKAAQAYQLESFVRLNGDSPLHRSAIIDRGIELYSGHSVDLATNIFPRSFPKGQSVEVVRVSAFQKALSLAQEPDDFEHATHVFYRLPTHFQIKNFQSDTKLNHRSFAIDDASEMDVFSKLVMRMKRPHWEYSVDELIVLQDEILQARSS